VERLDLRSGPEPYLDDKTIDEKASRVIGGSSSINAMIFNLPETRGASQTCFGGRRPRRRTGDVLGGFVGGYPKGGTFGATVGRLAPSLSATLRQHAQCWTVCRSLWRPSRITSTAMVLTTPMPIRNQATEVMPPPLLRARVARMVGVKPPPSRVASW